MKKIVIRCWFIESEDFIKEIIGQREIEYEPVDDYRKTIGLSTGYEDWILDGNAADVDSLVESLENTDYDIEVLTMKQYYRFY